MSGLDEDRAELIGMIRESAGAVVGDGELTRVRALRYQEPGFGLDSWETMAELGWIGLRVGEADGGGGLGALEACVLHEELGKGLTPEPLVAAQLAAVLLAATGGRTELAELLTGEQLAVVAWQARAGTLELADALDQPRVFTPAADAAKRLLLPVCDGVAFELHAFEAGEIRLEPLALRDGGFAFTVLAEPGGGRRIGEADADILRAALDEAALSTAAYLLGVGGRALDLTLAYLRERRQFDRPLGAFQALQHRCADMRIQLALAEASIYGAAEELDAGASSPRRQSLVSRAKARAADAALLITREAVQMHGAIGYTDEHDIGLFARKAMVAANQFGGAIAHRARFATGSED
jgi:alkylation response protein AidB-like acyl-CoA dehydrogenase